MACVDLFLVFFGLMLEHGYLLEKIGV